MRIDPRRYNGAMFLGLNGIAVKSHGGTDAFGFANAIGVAVDMMRQRHSSRRSATDLARLTAAPPPRQPAGGSALMIVRSQVAGCGAYLPERVVTNDELAARARHLGRMDPRSAPASGSATSPPTAS